ncbi:MAG: DUF2058 family protein [Alphaproteobacteria bacterium]|nr:DUF2058 family protein [Alphaproteobacteria bacterium]
MSLRDQLLKAGLVSKKDARRVNQELKKDRKESQGSKQKKKALEREARAAEEARRNAEQEARLAERRERTEARDRYEAALRVRNLILGNRVKNRGPHRFFFKGRDGRTVHRIEIQAGVAKELANGRLAIALIDHGTREEYVLVGRSAADRIAEVDPSVLVHFCPGPHAPDPSEALMEKDWEPSLGPHRV